VAAASTSVPDPSVQIEEMARLFRNNDLMGLAQAAIPASKWEQFRSLYDLKRTEPVSDDEREKFAEQIDRIAGPDAVDKLMAEIEPKLEENRPKLPGAMLMGFGALQMAINSEDSELTPEQRESLRQAFPGIQQWANDTDFLSSDKMRQALTLVSDAVRNAGVMDLDQLRALPLETALQRGGDVLSAAKRAVGLYGIDINAIADTLKVETLEIDGDTARVRATVTVFNAPFSIEYDLVLVEGRWYGKDAAEHIRIADIDG